MLDTLTKEQFITLRAENKSYTQIMKELQIGKNSCIKLNAELRHDIAAKKAERIQELQQQYQMAKEARIKKLGSTLQRIDAALEMADFSEMAPERLLDYKLKYERALKEEYVDPPAESAPVEITPEGIAELQMDLLTRIKLGTTSGQQAQLEIDVINGLQKSYEDLTLSEKVEALKALLEDRSRIICKDM